MQLRIRPKIQEKSLGTRLSTQPPTNILKAKTKTNLNVGTVLIAKQIVRVYVDETDNKKYLDRPTYHSLFSNTRTIMLDNKESLIEISDSKIQNLSKNHFEIEYVLIAKKKEKPRIIVYTDGSNKYIDMSAAYSLNLSTDEEFANSVSGDKYSINDNLMTFLLNNYEVEYSFLQEIQIDKKR